MTAPTTTTASAAGNVSENSLPFDCSELMQHFTEIFVEDMDLDVLIALTKSNKKAELAEMLPCELYHELNHEINLRGFDDDERLENMMMQLKNAISEESDKAFEEITSMTANSGDVVKLNAPAWFENPDFIAAIESPGVMTWHKAGQPVGEYSDVVMFVDPSLNEEGAEQDVCPEPIWQAIIAACKRLVGEKKGVDQVMVRITNLQE